jgi:hypothetical protein
MVIEQKPVLSPAGRVYPVKERICVCVGSLGLKLEKNRTWTRSAFTCIMREDYHRERNGVTGGPWLDFYVRHHAVAGEAVVTALPRLQLFRPVRSR